MQNPILSTPVLLTICPILPTPKYVILPNMSISPTHCFEHEKNNHLFRISCHFTVVYKYASINASVKMKNIPDVMFFKV